MTNLKDYDAMGALIVMATLRPDRDGRLGTATVTTVESYKDVLVRFDAATDDVVGCWPEVTRVGSGAPIKLNPAHVESITPTPRESDDA